MKAALPDTNEVGRCGTCAGKRSPFQLRSNIKNTSTFKSKHSNEVYEIKKNFNCNFKMVVYLIGFRVAESNRMVVSCQSFVLQLITIKAYITILGKHKSCQTNPVTETFSKTLSLECWKMNYAEPYWTTSFLILINVMFTLHIRHHSLCDK